MSQDIPNPTESVDISDSLISKLEIVLSLSKYILAGTWSMWAIALIVQIFAPVINAMYGIEIDTAGAKSAADALLPLNASLITLLLGYIIGRKK